MEDMIYMLVYSLGVAAVILAVIMLIVAVVMLIFAVISYILQGKAMYAIAQRRGIPNTWMAWVPFCNSWMMGAISDQYQLAAYGTVNNRRRKLLILHIICTALCSLAVVFGVAELYILEYWGDNDSLNLLVSLHSGCVEAAMLAVLVIFSIDYYKAAFDLFRSSDPDRSILYLMLSIFVQFPMPFLVFACRNKDDGMPPEPEQLPENT